MRNMFFPQIAHSCLFLILRSPEAIKWSIDGEVVREVTKESTDKGSGPRYPTSPSQIQIGLWDGSDAAGTAAWAQGPIDVSF